MKTAAKGLWLLAAAFLLSVFKYFRWLNLFQICCKKAVYYKILKLRTLKCAYAP